MIFWGWFGVYVGLFFKGFVCSHFSGLFRLDKHKSREKHRSRDAGKRRSREAKKYRSREAKKQGKAQKQKSKEKQRSNKQGNKNKITKHNVYD